MISNFGRSTRIRSKQFARIGCLAAVSAAAIFVAGCTTTNKTESDSAKAPPPAEKEKVLERGWIGGEFKLARRPSFGLVFFGTHDEYIEGLPRDVKKANRAGVLVTALGTNAPARQAGLREGDLILSLDHQPVTSLRAFHHQIDRRQPGTALQVAAWRDGKPVEFDVPVGRETYKNWGAFTIGAALPNPSNLGPFGIWPNPSFDLGVVGFNQTGERKEIESVEEKYQRSLKEKHETSDEDWKAYLAIFSVWRGKTILSQENVPTGGTPGQPK